MITTIKIVTDDSSAVLPALCEIYSGVSKQNKNIVYDDTNLQDPFEMVGGNCYGDFELKMEKENI